MNTLRVLLIEPDKQLGEVYAEALTAAGHKVVVAREAQEALEAADQLVPEIIILELQLARHNGVEFLYEFRSYPDWQNVPVIINSGVFELPINADLFERLGIKAVLYKPTTTLRRLKEVVNQFVPVV